MIRSAIYLTVLVLMSSCTMILIDEIRGGHSPMMQLDGDWEIEEHMVIDEDGNEEDIQESERCNFDATQDVGDYCVGSWLERITGSDNNDFLWGIDEEGEVFKLQMDGQDVFWQVQCLEKNAFHIQRKVNGKTYRMMMAR